MLKNKYAHIKVRKMTRAFVFALVLAAVLAVSYSGFSKIRPTIERMAVLEATNTVLMAINGVVGDSVASSVTYGDIVTLSRDMSGSVTALEINMPLINRIRSDVEVRIMRSISSGPGSRFLASVGGFFKIPMRISSVNAVQSQLVGTFESVGANQTRHWIAIFISVDIEVAAPGIKTSAEVSTEVGLAETVIVGTMPERYSDIDRRAESIEEAVFNYFAIMP